MQHYFTTKTCDTCVFDVEFTYYYYNKSSNIYIFINSKRNNTATAYCYNPHLYVHYVSIIYIGQYIYIYKIIQKCMHSWYYENCINNHIPQNLIKQKLIKYFYIFIWQTILYMIFYQHLQVLSTFLLVYHIVSARLILEII